SSRSSCGGVPALEGITKEKCRAAGCVWRDAIGNRRAVCAARVNNKTRLIDIKNAEQISELRKNPGVKIIKVNIYPRTPSKKGKGAYYTPRIIDHLTYDEFLKDI